MGGSQSTTTKDLELVETGVKLDRVTMDIMRDEADPVPVVPIIIWDDAYRVGAGPLRYFDTDQDPEVKKAEECFRSGRPSPNLARMNVDFQFDVREQNYYENTDGGLREKGKEIDLDPRPGAESLFEDVRKSVIPKRETVVRAIQATAGLTGSFFELCPSMSMDMKRIVWFVFSSLFVIVPWMVMGFLVLIEDLPFYYMIPGAWATFFFLVTFAINIIPSSRDIGESEGRLSGSSMLLILAVTMGCVSLMLPLFVYGYEHSRERYVGIFELATMCLHPTMVEVGMVLNMLARNIRPDRTY